MQFSCDSDLQTTMKTFWTHSLNCGVPVIDLSHSNRISDDALLSGSKHNFRSPPRYRMITCAGVASISWDLKIPNDCACNKKRICKISCYCYFSDDFGRFILYSSNKANLLDEFRNWKKFFRRLMVRCYVVLCCSEKLICEKCAYVCQAKRIMSYMYIVSCRRITYVL